MNVITTLSTWLNSAPWLNLLFLILALLGITTSIIFYYKSKKEQTPYYRTQSFTLIKNSIGKIDDIEITYQGTKIRNLTLTKFAFWNQGRDTINFDDVAPADKLRLEVEEGFKFLKAEISYQTKEANNTRIKLDKDKGLIMIEFDYFHTNEGFVLEIYHTGTMTENIKFKGTIKSAPTLKHIHDYELDNPMAVSFLKMITPEVFVKMFDSKYDAIILTPFIILLLPIMIPLMILDVIFRKKLPNQFRFLQHEAQTNPD